MAQPHRKAVTGIPSVPRIAILEARMSHELARLVEKHGGDPICVPALEERPEIDDERVTSLVAALADGAYDVAIFMTGKAASLLFEGAERVGRRTDLVAGLRRVTTVCRGPKPTAALRGFGVTPTLTARESFTSAEVIDAIGAIELKGCRVLLFHHGERSDSLAETLMARQAVVDEQWLYRWRLPEDTSALERLVGRLIEGDVDALAITCQIQFRHLFHVAQRLGLEVDLVRTLNERIVVGAVGPTCQAILRVHGVDVDVVPDHPKMGPLVVSLMRYFERNAVLPRSEAGAS
jgi:uroporphyrinogen-III synthase